MRFADEIFDFVEILVGSQSRGFRRGNVVEIVAFALGIRALDGVTHTLDDAFALRFGVYGEIVAVAYTVGVGTQNSCAHRVKSACPHPGIVAEDGGNPFFHFVCCFVRKCYCKYVVWADALFNQSTYSSGEHARLAAAGTGNDQNRAFRIAHGKQLFVVQSEIVLHTDMITHSARIYNQRAAIREPNFALCFARVRNFTIFFR